MILRRRRTVSPGVTGQPNTLPGLLLQVAPIFVCKWLATTTTVHWFPTIARHYHLSTTSTKWIDSNGRDWLVFVNSNLPVEFRAASTGVEVDPCALVDPCAVVDSCAVVDPWESCHKKTSLYSVVLLNYSICSPFVMLICDTDGVCCYIYYYLKIYSCYCLILSLQVC